MNSDKTKYRNIIPYIAILITVILWLAVPIFHAQRLWGIDHLSYFSISWSLTYIAFLIILFIIVSGKIHFAVFNNIKSSISIRWKRLPQWLKLVLTGIPAICIFWLLRDRTKLLGDSFLRIGELSDKSLDRLLSTSAAEPLDYIIHYAIYKYICLPLSLSSILCYELVSYLAGLIYLWAGWSVARQLKSEKISFWLTFFYLLGWGGICMFFGYAEEYGLAASALLLFTYYVIRYISKGKNIIAVAIVFLIGFFLHNLLLILLPSILYLLFIEYKSNKKKAITILTGIVIPVLGWLMLSYGKKESGAFLLPSSGTEPGYILWGRVHLIDMMNELLLICPAVIVLLFLQVRGKMPSIRINHLRVALGLAALSGLTVLIFVDPQLGMARDWDLYALPLLSFNIALFLGVDWSKAGSFLKSAIILIMLGFTFSWIVINAGENLALSRYEKLLPLDYARGRYGYDRLGFYYTSNKKLPEAEAAYKKSIQIKPHPRSLLNLAYVQMDLGKNDEAIATFKKLLLIQPVQPIVLYELGWLYYNLGQYQNALDTFVEFQQTPEGKNNAEVAQDIGKLKSMLSQQAP